MNTNDRAEGIEIKTIGDSRGYLWRIIIDKKRGFGKIEKVSGLCDINDGNELSIDGAEYPLQSDSLLSDDMQHLTSKIESRFRAAWPDHFNEPVDIDGLIEGDPP